MRRNEQTKCSMGPTVAQQDRANERNLTRLAKERCEGCRLNWRFEDAETWRHREPLPIICTAQAIRIKLGRNLAPGSR